MANSLAHNNPDPMQNMPRRNHHSATYGVPGLSQSIDKIPSFRDHESPVYENKIKLQGGDADYDPFRINEQRYLEMQRHSDIRRSIIYQRHMDGVVMENQAKHEEIDAGARQREE